MYNCCLNQLIGILKSLTQLVGLFVFKQSKRELTGKFIFHLIKVELIRKVPNYFWSTLQRWYQNLELKVKKRCWHIFFLWFFSKCYSATLLNSSQYIQTPLNIHYRKRYISRMLWKRVVLVKNQVFMTSFYHRSCFQRKFFILIKISRFWSILIRTNEVTSFETIMQFKL